MDEPGGHYMEWSKAGIQGQISHDIIYMWNVRVKLIEAENGIVVASSTGWEWEGDVGHTVQWFS